MSNQFSLFTVVNKANGTDYELDCRNCPNVEELKELIAAAIVSEIKSCVDNYDMPPSSFVFSVVLY